MVTVGAAIDVAGIFSISYTNRRGVGYGVSDIGHYYYSSEIILLIAVGTMCLVAGLLIMRTKSRH